MTNESDPKYYQELLKEYTMLRLQIGKERRALEKKHRHGPFSLSEITVRLPYMSEEAIRHHLWPHDPENPTLKEIIAETTRLRDLDERVEACEKTLEALAVRLGRDVNKDMRGSFEEWSPLYRYPRLLAERASLTAKMRAIDRGGSSVSQKDRHDRYDADRQAIHRELEALGTELGKDATQVRLDILSSQFGNRELGLPGITAVDATWRELDGDDGWDQPMVDRDEMNAVGSSRLRHWDGVGDAPSHRDGIALIYDYSYIRETGWGGSYESSRFSGAFSDLLETHATELCRRIKQRFPSSRVRLSTSTDDFSGVLHLNRQLAKFVYVDAANAEAVVSWIGHHPESWMSAEEYGRTRETETSLYCESPISYAELTGFVGDKTAKIATQAAIETIFRRDGADENTVVEVRTIASLDRSSYGIFIRDKHQASSLADGWEAREEAPALVPMTDATAYRQELKKALREPSSEPSRGTRRI